MLATVYFLMRSLACELPHEASREFLFDYFEEIRLKYIAGSTQKNEGGKKKNKKNNHRSKIDNSK